MRYTWLRDWLCFGRPTSANRAENDHTQEPPGVGAGDRHHVDRHVARDAVIEHKSKADEARNDEGTDHSAREGSGEVPWAQLRFRTKG